jgi:hypothetical protein
MIDEDAIRQRWEAVGSKLDERGRRLFAAGEVRAAGWGGLAAVSRITGLARSTINRGKVDLDAAALPRGGFAGPVAGVARSPRTTLGSFGAPMADRADGAGRSDAAVDLGLEKHGEARRDPDRDGASDQRRYGAQGVGEARVLAPIQQPRATTLERTVDLTVGRR